MTRKYFRFILIDQPAVALARCSMPFLADALLRRMLIHIGHERNSTCSRPSDSHPVLRGRQDERLGTTTWNTSRYRRSPVSTSYALNLRRDVFRTSMALSDTGVKME